MQLDGPWRTENRLREAHRARFPFHSPPDNRLDRETYFPRLLADQQDDWGFDFINLVTDADRVFVTDEGRDTERPWLVIRETG